MQIRDLERTLGVAVVERRLITSLPIQARA
jgi:hypothetical protein